MDYPKITKLYKYTPFSVRSISALITGQIWIPKPNTLNDPFDCNIVNHSKGLLPSLKKERKEFVKSIRQLRPDVPDQSDLEQIFYSINDKYLTTITERDQELVRATQDAYATLQSSIYSFGILSLSATPRNILMWSHYGSNHTGICFEFERGDHNKLGTEAKPVTYSHRRESNDTKLQNDTWDLFFVKHRGWKYEKEWRFLESKGNRLYDFPGKLTSVICGPLMPQQDIKTIELLLDLLNAKHTDKIGLKYASMSDKNYTISISKKNKKK